MFNFEMLKNYQDYVSSAMKIFQLSARTFACTLTTKWQAEVLAEMKGVPNMYQSLANFGLVNPDDSDEDEEMTNFIHSTSMDLLKDLEVHVPYFFKRCAQNADLDFLDCWVKGLENQIAKMEDFLFVKENSEHHLLEPASGNDQKGFTLKFKFFIQNLISFLRFE